MIYCHFLVKIKRYFKGLKLKLNGLMYKQNTTFYGDEINRRWKLGGVKLQGWKPLFRIYTIVRKLIMYLSTLYLILYDDVLNLTKNSRINWYVQNDPYFRKKFQEKTTTMRREQIANIAHCSNHTSTSAGTVVFGDILTQKRPRVQVYSLFIKCGSNWE